MEALPIAGALGAELRGLDLAQKLDDTSVEGVLDALYEHKVIFFRSQTLTPQQQIEFSAQLAPVFTDHPAYLPLLDGHPEVVVLDGQAGGRANLWHSDVSISPKPPMGSVLYMKQCPTWGGDTLWADMTAAHDALSDRMKTYLDGLHAVHDLAGTVRNVVRERSQQTKSPTGAMPDMDALPRAIHPVVRTHPVTGRKILYVNPTFTSHIDELPPAEGDALLAFLFQHQSQPEFQCRWRWQAGDVAIWDNRATHHYAVADYGDEARTIHRVTLEGEAPA
ncbi:MAG: TauD/TfdA family dioxygenase [Deltaproteobacteria bacterium]|nr:TauD/TfdA family dioxygenase [Deltaproteobacteria bacterium]